MKKRPIGKVGRRGLLAQAAAADNLDEQQLLQLFNAYDDYRRRARSKGIAPLEPQRWYAVRTGRPAGVVMYQIATDAQQVEVVCGGEVVGQATHNGGAYKVITICGAGDAQLLPDLRRKLRLHDLADVMELCAALELYRVIRSILLMRYRGTTSAADDTHWPTRRADQLLPASPEQYAQLCRLLRNIFGSRAEAAQAQQLSEAMGLGMW